MIKPGWMGLKGECYELDLEEDSLKVFFSSLLLMLTFFFFKIIFLMAFWAKTCILVDATSIEPGRF